MNSTQITVYSRQSQLLRAESKKLKKIKKKNAKEKCRHQNHCNPNRHLNSLDKYMSKSIWAKYILYALANA